MKGRGGRQRLKAEEEGEEAEQETGKRSGEEPLILQLNFCSRVGPSQGAGSSW